jgi:class 3 adenylate cyclase
MEERESMSVRGLPVSERQPALSARPATSDLAPRLDALRETDAIPGTLLDDFKTFLERAPDEDLFRMSPLRYAASRGIAEQQAIDLFLHATHAGILEFAWGVLCPGCMAFLTTPGGLRGIQKKRCQLCGITTGEVVDDRVEVAFTVAPSVRRIRFHDPDRLDLRKDAVRLYFSSSVASESVPHQNLQERMLATGRVSPGAAQEVSVTLDEGYTVMVTPMSHAAAYIHAQPGADLPRTLTLELLDGHAIPSSVEAPAGPVVLRIVNRAVDSVGFVVTPIGTSWPKPAGPGEPLTHPVEPYLTGSRLVSSQVFRELFRAESIPSEGGLELKGVTVLFTDLKGSTAIYERVGDLRAYDLVRRHFVLLRRIAAAHGGAIVKTIGDAVMASFDDPAAAVRAAVEMHREIRTLGEGELALKIGLHSGPCIAVDFNDRLDYFGRTVNIAARVQGVAGAGEIACTEPVFEALGVREALEGQGFVEERASVPLKGIIGDVPVVRLKPAKE